MRVSFSLSLNSGLGLGFREGKSVLACIGKLILGVLLIFSILGIIFKEIALIPYLNNVNDNVNVEL